MRRWSHYRRALGALMALGLLLAGRHALADDTPKSETASEPAAAVGSASESQKLKAEGDDAMQRLDYAAALAAYDKAYALEPNAALLYNRGRALQALRRFPEALDQLEAFEREAPSELKARVPKLGELIQEVKAKVATLAVTCNVSGARVLVRGSLVGTTPLTKSMRINAGPATIEVVADGFHPLRKSVLLTSGETLQLEATLFSKATTGVLEVRSPVVGATVFVDGRRVGTVPAQTMLAAGRHRVVVRHEKYDEAETFAVIQAGKNSRLDVPLEAQPGITSRWWFWTGVGVVVAGGIAVTAALLTERSPDEGDIPPGRVSGPLLAF